MLSTYRREITHDFAAHLPSIDWQDLWRRRRWGDLMWHIDHLPRNSHYRQALATDEDLAREMVKHGFSVPDNPDAGRPDVSEFDLSADLLTMVVNELRRTQATMVSIAGGSNQKVEPLKGPVYAIEKVEASVRQQMHASLAARLVPHLYPDGPRTD